jgi:hypothetical protein
MDGMPRQAGSDGNHAAAFPWFFNQNASATQLMPNPVE